MGVKQNTKYIEEVLHSGAWKGKRCFLIGGGPSIVALNPNVLNGELVIGVNKAFVKFNSTINYAMDMRLSDFLVASPNGYDMKERKEIERVQECWNNYKGIKAFLMLTPKYGFSEGVCVVRRLHERTVSFDLNKGIYPGSNSGFGAMMLAVALGANPIYLLGYDFQVDEKNNKTHWHEGYARQNFHSFVAKLSKFRKLFENFAPHLENSKIEVVNLSSESALNCFPKSTIDEVLNG